MLALRRYGRQLILQRLMADCAQAALDDQTKRADILRHIRLLALTVIRFSRQRILHDSEVATYVFNFGVPLI